MTAMDDSNNGRQLMSTNTGKYTKLEETIIHEEDEKGPLQKGSAV